MSEQLAPDVDTRTSGQRLAQGRKDRNLSVADAAAKLRIAPRQIEALEADDYERLPGHTIARGFVRNYARLLQLNPELVLEAFEKHAPKETNARISLPDQKVQFSEGGNWHPNRRVLWLTLGILVFTALGYGLWRWELLNARPVAPVVNAPVKAPEVANVETPVVPSGSPSLPSPMASAALPTAATPEPTISSAPTVDHVVHLVFDAPAWVEVRDAEGKVVWQKTNVAGSEADITLAPPLAFTIGNAAKVKMTYNGDAFDLTPHIQGSIARFKLDR
jgi:cytoskeleton protein RodZ